MSPTITTPAMTQAGMISANGGDEARGAPDGQRLYYRSPDQWLMFSSVVSEEPFEMSTPERLFPIDHFETDTIVGAHTYDVAPDGRFLFVRAEEEGDAELANRVVVVQNWFTELERLVP